MTGTHPKLPTPQSPTMDTPYGYPDAPTLTWHVAPVSEDEEHIRLTYGDPQEDDWDKWPVVARMSRPVDDVFRVEWLVDPEAEPEMVRAATQTIDFIMIWLREPDPWAYACYRCGTAGNLYSMVHLAHITPDSG